MRIRDEPESNYRGMHVEGMTLRIALDPSRPISELRFPEFYDIKITNACGGGCPYCYQDSGGTAHYPSVVDKIKGLFEPMTLNQRPFQIAYGGGEPTLHPEFTQLLRATRALGISPNYTTNGMGMTQEIVDATVEYCDGVAVSTHPHLQHYWIKALGTLSKAGVKANLHCLVSDRPSIDRALGQIERQWDLVHKFILLPYEAQGRAKPVPSDYDYLFAKLREIDVSQIGFGAGFYPLLLEERWLDVSLYAPESMSKYIDLGDMTIHPSSFQVNNGQPIAAWLGERVAPSNPTRQET